DNREEKVAWLYLAARLALGKILHDLIILLIQLIERQHNDDDRPNDQRAKLVDVDDHIQRAVRLRRAAGGRADKTTQTKECGDQERGQACADLGADRAAGKDHALLTDVGLPLTVFDRITQHAKYDRVERRQ